jgi:hypothetical protein
MKNRTHYILPVLKKTIKSQESYKSKLLFGDVIASCLIKDIRNGQQIAGDKG